MATDAIRSKPDAAVWAMNHLPEEYKPVMQRARAICIGEENEVWDDIQAIIQPCADFMVRQINVIISSLQSSNIKQKSIKLAK